MENNPFPELGKLSEIEELKLTHKYEMEAATSLASQYIEKLEKELEETKALHIYEKGCLELGLKEKYGKKIREVHDRFNKSIDQLLDAHKEEIEILNKKIKELEEIK